MKDMIMSISGLPFNIASYGLLLHIIAKMVNMVPEELIGNLGDTHLYSNHIEQAELQIGRIPFQLPNLKLGEDKLSIVDWYNTPLDAMIENLKLHKDTDIIIEDYVSHSAIKAPLSN